MATNNAINATSTPFTVGSGGDLTLTYGNYVATNSAASAVGVTASFYKNRSGGVITTGDVLGSTVYYGHDGTNPIESAKIVATSTGTIATNRVGSTLKFYTHPDSTSAAALNLTLGADATATFSSSCTAAYVYSVNSYYGASYTGTASIRVGASVGGAAGTMGVFLGGQAGASSMTGNWNTYIGWRAGYLTGGTGSCNVCIGVCDKNPGDGQNASGSDLSGSDHSNLLIMNAGTAGDVHTIRIGKQGTSAARQDKCYIAGIYNTAVGATAGVVLSDSAHKLGGLAGAANTIFVGGTSPSFTATPQCTDLTLTGILKLPTTSSTVGQVQINSTRVLHTYGTDNTFVGAGAGNFTLHATNTYSNIGIGVAALDAMGDGAKENTAIGKNAGGAITTAENNVCIGVQSGASVTTGSFNMLIGGYSGDAITDGASNTGIGLATLGSMVSGTYNTAIGYTAMYTPSAGSFSVAVGSNALRGALTGSNNIGIGTFDATTGGGSALTTTDHSNICIGNVGVAGDVHIMRIGTQGTGAGEQDATYIAGIYNTSVGATAGVVLSDSAHKLGGLAGAANTIFVGGTKPSFTASPQCTDLTLTGTIVLPSTEITADTYNLAINKTYVVNNANMSVCQLPGTAAVGSWIEVIGKSAAMWKIESTAAKNIKEGASTTSGAGGKVEATQQYTSIMIKCITADADWVIVSRTGTVTIA